MQASEAPAAAVEITGLEKVYDGGKQALKRVNLTIPRGSMFGLLGPNGAGKSTLINILAGLVRKSSGRVRIWGIDIDEAPRAARAAIGIMPQEIALDPFFPARSALELQAGLFGIPKAERRTDELLSALGLMDKADAPARSLSGGMRRRLMMAKALVHSPPILVLDEPTAGVDVGLRQQLWDYVRHLNRAGTTVLLTTHYIQEAEELCDRVAILMDGEILVSDRTDAFLDRVQDRELMIELSSPLSEVPEALRRFDPLLVSPDQLVFRYAHGSDLADQIFGAIRDAGLHVREITTERPDLESMFLDMLRRR